MNCGTGEKKNLTVITNSVELASEICSIESWNVYMPGGQLRPESMALSANSGIYSTVYFLLSIMTFLLTKRATNT